MPQFVQQEYSSLNDISTLTSQAFLCHLARECAIAQVLLTCAPTLGYISLIVLHHSIQHELSLHLNKRANSRFFSFVVDNLWFIL